MRISKYLTLVIVITLFTSLAHAAVSTSPSTVNAAKGRSTGVTISYSFSGIPTGTYTLTSSSGDFLLGVQNIGSINITLNANIQNGAGRVSETITIPLSVIERAFRAGSGTFVYQREFTGSTATQIAIVNIRITPESIAKFSLRRVELYFDGKEKRAEKIVNRNFKRLKAHTDIYFNGSGFLQGYWEVDGRVIENISRHVSFGAKVTLSTPDIPGIPTFEPGFHIVKFVVTSPQAPFELPQILYWVTAKEEPVKKALDLVTPKKGAIISPDEEFRWDKIEGISVYLVAFIKEDGRTIVFSALTRGNYYRIPQSVFSRFFTMDTKYIWHVKGFDDNGNIILESEARGMKVLLK